jgi:23S rRNA (adenine2503-C2)-methyltransferase
MQHLLEPATWNSLQAWLADRGQKPFRAAQIRKWVFEGRAESFEEMSDLPKALRTELAAEFQLWSGTIALHSQSGDGTAKLLVELADGGRIECVLLRDDDRRTICISTQVGCAMGCVFCASGLDGVDRNLTAGEIAKGIADKRKRQMSALPRSRTADRT